ncbi:unnamed protein product [Schistosoma curassoni]|uniref:Uncharacterized protein n=1 Tax=Schistosoma curassoni TaxID=6186 RepID=A0A183K2B1_9TREM|nr:unnamed protein product [Schistosoma curassoni]
MAAATAGESSVTISTTCRLYNFSFGLLISLYLFIFLLHNFFDCQDLCEQLLDEKVVHENDSYKYECNPSVSNTHTQSYNNYYEQRICLIQSHPVVNGGLFKLPFDKITIPTYRFKYFGNDADHININNAGEITIQGEKLLGKISNRIAGIENYDLESLALKEHVCHNTYGLLSTENI